MPRVFLGAVMVVAFYQVVYPGPTSLRLWLCGYGAIHPLHMVAFDFTRDNEVSILSTYKLVFV